nr:quinic acid utilization activator [Quercus suber]
MSGVDADQPPQKRSRVSRACDQCRNGRERCDGAQPCHTCGLQRRHCSYHEQPKKRGIQPNYIRTLELTLAWLFDTFPEIESQLATVLSDHTAEVPKLITGKDPTRTETLHQVWRNGIIGRQIDQALSGAPIEEVKPVVPEGRVSRKPALIASKDGITRPVGEGAASKGMLTRSEDANAEAEMTGSPTKLKLPHDAWTLVEYYWAFTHTWLPIAEKASVLQVVYSYPPNGVSSETASSPEHAELWSIMALAASQLASIGRREDDPSIRETARSLLPSEYDGTGLGYIKALLLLGLLDITNEKWLPAWLLVGSAIRLLLFNRGACKLGQFITEDRSDHVCLAAFILESCIAEVLHSSTHIRIDNISAIGFISEQGLEEWSPWSNPFSEDSMNYGKVPARSCSTFNNVIRLTIYNLEPESQQIIAEKQFENASDRHPVAGFQVPKTPTSIDPAPNRKSSTTENVVLTLTRNASRTATSTQQHPSAVISSLMSSLNKVQTQPTALSMSSIPSPVQHRFLPNSPGQDSPVRGYRNFNVAETTELPSVNPTTSSWLHGSLNDMPLSNGGIDDIDGSTITADIFQEFAMLERKDANQHPPQFMQNLGFAPDLDLAEFFGADYLPSDPMLAYVQNGSHDTGFGKQTRDGG